MAEAARALFDTLTSYKRIKDLIDEGEVEDQYLECKAPVEPRLTRDYKAKLAQAASGFANSGGGVIIWGVSTTHHSHSGLDVLSGIEPIGNVIRLAQQIDRELPRLTTPQLTFEESRILYRIKKDSRGVAVTYIPAFDGDPIQSTVDRNFYIRTGDDFREMPYETLQRMFTGTKAPVLRPIFDPALISVDGDGLWNIQVGVANDSTAVARDVCVTIEALNSDACETITSSRPLEDTSSINPDAPHFSQWFTRPVHRGLNILTGSLLVKMKRGRSIRRRLDLGISIFADGMRARHWTYNIQLSSGGFQVKGVKDAYIE